MDVRNGEAMTLCAVGDVCVVNHEDVKSIFEFTVPIIRDADISFCQLEISFSDRDTASLACAYH